MLSYAPDLDPTTPDVLTACDGYVPTIRSYKPMPSQVEKTDALGGECRGLYLGVKLDNTTRLFAGQATSIQQLDAASWTNRGTYTTHSDKWQFAQFGNVSLACRLDQKVQASTTGSFSDIAAAPKAKVIATSNSFVMVGNYDDGVNVVPDGWFCSGFYDHTNWTPAIATQCANGRLFDTPGEITAIHRLGDDLVFFKKDSCYHARYVGPPIVWEFRLVSPSSGCFSQDCVCNIGNALIWASEFDFWYYDGASPPRSIGDGIRNMWSHAVFPAYRNKTIAHHDINNFTVFFWYVSFQNPGAAKLDKFVCYNYRSNRWGAGSMIIEDVMRYDFGITYGDIAASGVGSYDDHAGGTDTYDVALWGDSKAPKLTVINDSHKLATVDGTPGVSSMTTGDIGEVDQVTLLRRVTPKLLSTPDSATLTYYGREHVDDEAIADGSTLMDSRRRFDFFNTARWHRVKLETTGPCEITGFKPDFVPQGVE
jgi:hypothetical protein